MARRAPGETWEAYADRQVREAQERGEFDDLDGLGKPLPDLHRPRDGDWWITRKLREEQFVRVPPALELRRDVDVARSEIAGAASEAEVRALLDTINARIRHANATIISGPPSTVWPLDVERTVARWRADHPDAPDGDDGNHDDDGGSDDGGPGRRRRWWRVRRR